jgi:hypothetical protein
MTLRDELLKMLDQRIDKAREIAINLLNLGINPSIVSEATELSLDELEELPNFEHEYFDYRYGGKSNGK